MLCEPTCLDNEEKEEDNISGDHLINIKRFTTYIEKYLVCQQCAYENSLQMILEEERYQENFISYVDNSYDLPPTDGKQGIRKLHHDFN